MNAAPLDPTLPRSHSIPRSAWDRNRDALRPVAKGDWIAKARKGAKGAKIPRTRGAFADLPVPNRTRENSGRHGMKLKILTQV